jgi:pantetheine-phosphate adenylyltransferase
MKIAIYPGSFLPIHLGHLDIIDKALKVFDKVLIAQLINPDKQIDVKYDKQFYQSMLDLRDKYNRRTTYTNFSGLLVDLINKRKSIIAVIRGLRNGNDLQYEQNMQYWNEDLGLTVPIVYFVTDRRYAHYSSSSIRAINKFKMEKL